MADDVTIRPGLVIPGEEFRVTATRAGGPGGQHVNKTSTRIELRWNVPASRALDPSQRARLLERLAGRLDQDGNLRIVVSESRSQVRNRETAVQRFRGVVLAGLRVPKPRRSTRPTRASIEKRLADKRKRSDRKKQRRPVDE